MKIRLLLAMVATFASLAVLSCTATKSTVTAQGRQTKTIAVSYDDLLNQKFVSRDITLAVGDTLQVTLASNNSTGFRWTAKTQIGDPAVVRQTDHKRVGPTSSAPGASGTEVWTFDALKAGATSIATDYSRPWPGGTKGEWTFKANVTVQ
jgi:inhibitor of cysteine peptidase